MLGRSLDIMALLPARAARTSRNDRVVGADVYKMLSLVTLQK